MSSEEMINSEWMQTMNIHIVEIKCHSRQW